MKFRLVNCTRETWLASELERTENAWQRLKGLLGKSESDFGSGKGLWIVPTEAIHTIGMSFPIDVVYLDSRHRVILVYHRLEPYRFGALRRRARSVVELPAGILAETGTQVGDQLHFLARWE